MHTNPGLARSHRRPPSLAARLAVLIALSVLAWAVAPAGVWLVRAYLIAALSAVVSLAVVASCLYLAVRGNWRARVLAAGIYVALIGLVLLVMSR